MKKQLLTILLATACCTTTLRAATLVQSTFGSSAESWDVISLANGSSGVTPNISATYSVNYLATGGNPGGYISEPDQDTNFYYYRAPANFLGNQSAAVGGTLSIDIADGPVNTLNSVAIGGLSPLILVGATESIYFGDNDLISTSFQTFSFSLAPGAGTGVNAQSGMLATTADFTTVLSNLQGVYLLGDYYNGADTSSLDNVILSSSVPEPTTLVPAGLGALGALLLLRRRRGSCLQSTD